MKVINNKLPQNDQIPKNYEELRGLLLQLANGDRSDEAIEAVLRPLANGSFSGEELRVVVCRELSDPVETCNVLGVKCFEYGLHDEVIPLLNAALELDPTNSDALFNLGFVLQSCDEPEKALHYYERIVDKDEELQAIIDDLRAQMPACAASIIIPVYNKVDYTTMCLESVFKETDHLDYEVIVVDNASTDRTQDYLSSLDNPRLRVIRNEDNLGFVGACNQGAAAAYGKHLVFLNNDTVVIAKWLDELIGLAESDPQVGIVGAKLVYPNGQLQEAGGIVWQDGSGWNYGRGGNPKNPEFAFVREVDYVSGACLLIAKDLFERVGGFDKRYSPGYYEDTDLCFAVRAIGYKVMYQPRAQIIHFEGISSGTDLATGMKRFQGLHAEKFKQKWASALRQQYPAETYNVVPASTRATGKNILIIDQFTPVFDRASGSLRMYKMIEGMRRAGHFVTFIARNGDGQGRYVDQLERMGVQVYTNDIRKRRELGELVNGESIDLAEILSVRRYEIAWLSFYDVAEQYLREIRFFSPETKVLVDTVDVHYLREQRMAELSGDSSMQRRAMETRLRELNIYAQADRVLTVTAADGEHLREELPDLPVAVIPNLHDPLSNTAAFDERSGLLFVGNFGHDPNVDAMEFYIRDVWPLVKRQVPGVKLFIVGNFAERYCLNADPDIIVLGFVPDTQPFLQRCRLSIAPLRYGAGMKGKVGEAMMSGLPVVTTSIGSEGMGLEHGKHVLVADTAEEFAAETARLYHDDALWNTLVENGKLHIYENYSTEKVMDRVFDLFNELLAVKQEA